ncbi:MBL fold metallo-hydrolase [Thiomicrorhabdus hydrogeniphila]
MKKLNSAIKPLITALILGTPVTALANDAYSNSFKAYAEETHLLEKKNGYIGEKLPIPDLQKVADGVYTSIGSQIWGNRSNFGFNNNMTAVIFENGVMLYNAGPNPAVAYSFHKKLKKITDKPVKWIVIENHQGHANMGASYWHDVGVKNIYSEKQATEEWNEMFNKAKKRYMTSVSKVWNTPAYNATKFYTTFENSLVLDVGNNEKVYINNYGGGHTPTMSGVLVPSKNVVFTGDLGVNERLPGLFDGGDYKEWIDSFNKMEATMAELFKKPEQAIVIPGHGNPASISKIREKTVDYFVKIADRVKESIANGGGVEEAKKIDQSEYKDRIVFNQVAVPNAASVYMTLTSE